MLKNSIILTTYKYEKLLAMTYLYNILDVQYTRQVDLCILTSNFQILNRNNIRIHMFFHQNHKPNYPYPHGVKMDLYIQEPLSKAQKI